MPDSPSPANEKKRGRGCSLRFAAGTVALLAAAGYIAYHFENHRNPAAAGCTVNADGDERDLDPDQASNAATIAAVAMSRGLPERALTIALATSLQESRLENLSGGDRDSLGLFQQRPSQGWGTSKEILDPVYASNSFFDSLVKIPGYTRLPLTVAAQKVQRSGFPQAYAKHEADATLLSAALMGDHDGALSCTTGADTPYSAGGRLGSTATVTSRLTREFGRQVRPRDDGTPRTVAVPSAAPAGAAAGDGKRRGWELAQWAVAHAPDLKVQEVAFGDMRWQAEKSEKGWQRVGTGSPAEGSLVRITVAR